MGDLLYSFTEWLWTTPLVDLALWLSGTSLSLWIVSYFWAIPLIQVVHILAIAAGFGALLMINFRIFGIAGVNRTIAQTSQRYIPWMWWALVVLILTGLLMIIAEPERELINPIFWIKMVLVVFTILISIWYNKGILRDLAAGREITATERTVAGALIILWIVIMACGRWIAYAPV